MFFLYRQHNSIRNCLKLFTYVQLFLKYLSYQLLMEKYIELQENELFIFLPYFNNLCSFPEKQKVLILQLFY